MSEVVLLYVTVPNPEEGRRLGRILVEERLAACVNLFPGMQSLYWWEGKIQEDQEAVIIVKTRKGLVPRVQNRILDLHPYSCPCILEIPVSGGYKDFMAWIKTETL